MVDEYKVFHLPSLGEEAGDNAKVSFWYADIGEELSEGDSVIEMVTDKAVFEVPAPADITLLEVYVDEDDVVNVGDKLFSYKPTV